MTYQVQKINIHSDLRNDSNHLTTGDETMTSQFMVEQRSDGMWNVVSPLGSVHSRMESEQQATEFAARLSEIEKHQRVECDATCNY